VWAYRQKRIHGIAASIDLMLTLFPFEEDIYRQHNVPVRCVGHPLADQLSPP
jgi:lipid-A-disaccharide synthase